MNSRAIGVFDSGLGGLTAASVLHKLLPNERIVYFGDTARLPYGTRSKKTIIRYAESDLKFLLSNNIKAVLAACGTVSSNAMEALQKMCTLPIIIGVVEAAADTACKIALSGNKKVVILGTGATISSGAYEKYIKERYPEVEVYSKACPLFVPLAENKINCGNSVKKLVADEYLSEVSLVEPSAVILGCTHYILLADILKNYFKNSVLVDSGTEGAKKMKRMLENDKLLTNDMNSGAVEYYVSDLSDEFEKNAEMFMGDQKTKITEIDIDSVI